MRRGFVAALLFGLLACANPKPYNSKPYKPLDYDAMGLPTKPRGTMGAPEVGAPDDERLGHEKIESLQQEAIKARSEGAKAVQDLSNPASQPASQPK
jgi:hypothetical protein